MRNLKWKRKDQFIFCVYGGKIQVQKPGRMSSFLGCCAQTIKKAMGIFIAIQKEKTLIMFASHYDTPGQKTDSLRCQCAEGSPVFLFH